eukprot:2156996-Amphidinium_carterae.1
MVLAHDETTRNAHKQNRNPTIEASREFRSFRVCQRLSGPQAFVWWVVVSEKKINSCVVCANLRSAVASSSAREL